MVCFVMLNVKNGVSGFATRKERTSCFFVDFLRGVFERTVVALTFDFDTGFFFVVAIV
jgi:hypothetical protein